MVKRNNYSTNLCSSQNIYKKNIIINENTIFCNKYLLEFIENTSLDIGEYIYINKANYPIVEKNKGERIYAFEDKSRNGYCYDEIINNMKITMFIPYNIVKII